MMRVGFYTLGCKVNQYETEVLKGRFAQAGFEVEDFGTNEKIFYPPQELDASDAPLAQGGAGTLAYYVPWGDVVMFYDDYSQNPSLVELGQVVSGEAWIGQMAGTVTVDIADASEIANRAGGQTL